MECEEPGMSHDLVHFLCVPSAMLTLFSMYENSTQVSGTLEFPTRLVQMLVASGPAHHV